MANDENPPSNAGLAILLESRQTFLRYLERRVGSRDTAEDILQEVFARNLSRVDELPQQALVPWFYRTLRNAAIDHYRRRSTADKALDAFAREMPLAEAAPEHARAEICACVSRLAAALEPQYADALHAIDVNGTPVKTFAAQRGVSPGSAGVRVFRARKALRKRVMESCGACAERGCADCTCGVRALRG